MQANKKQTKGTIHERGDMNAEATTSYRARPALVPIRDGSLLVKSNRNPLKRKLPVPYIPLPTIEDSSSGCITIGRAELLIATSSACACLNNTSPPSFDISVSTSKFYPGRKRQRFLCTVCKSLEKWAIRFISRKMLRFESTVKSNDSKGEDVKHSDLSWTVTSLGQNSARIIQIDGVHLNNEESMRRQAVNIKRDRDGLVQVQNVPMMKMGSILTLKCPISRSNPNYSHKQEDYADLDKRSAKNLGNAMEFAVSIITEPIKSTLEDIKVYKSKKKKMNQPTSQIVNGDNKNKSAAHNQNDYTDSLARKGRCLEVKDAGYEVNDLTLGRNFKNEREYATAMNQKNTSVLHSDTFKEGCSNTRVDPQKHFYTLKYGDNFQDRSDEVRAGKNMMQNNSEKAYTQNNSGKICTQSNHTKKALLCSGDQNVNCVVFFLPRGKMMSKSRINLLSSSLKKNDGVVVLESFDIQCPPTHIVVDASISANDLSTSLGFQNVAEMAKLAQKIYIVNPDWATHFRSGFEKPTMNQCWARINDLKQELNKGKKNDSSSHEAPWLTWKGRQRDFAPISKVAASKVQNRIITKMCLERNRLSSKNSVGDKVLLVTEKNLNIKLSEMFERISTHYRECPLDQWDEWRSYSYYNVSRRLRQLDFEVENDPIILQRLSRIDGFGSKIMKQCKEYLASGTCQIFHDFEHDSLRKGVRNIIRIWGIGAKKSIELVRLGYTSIASVRKGLDCQALELNEGARIGVKYYEDFLEKMNRDEVRQISQIVEAACRLIYPEAEINIMGSYRRGKCHCGDVDIMITHPKYVMSTPVRALDELVERLRMSGHISDHLTKVVSHSTENNKDSFIGDDPCKRAASYMGVFVSPMYPGKRRRIDIKFYPYREKAFASLYFTGNSFFNRSMRLFTKRKKITLNEHGLFFDDGGDKKRARMEASTESEIFDALGLVYRRPHERDSFDAVAEISTGRSLVLSHFDKIEILNEPHNKWIE